MRATTGQRAAILHRGGGRARETLLLRGGVVGDRLPPLRAAGLPLAPGDTLVLATDCRRDQRRSRAQRLRARLYVAKLVAAAHGGAVTVRTRENGGAAFRIELRGDAAAG